ncbi:MAG TPA: GNAT family N-acetyltransferase [Candidatus Stackebrandtia faecavium]|nr:GNAT family N-acetyltransferase [Candidatus Stackebrandtia faecavium]
MDVEIRGYSPVTDHPACRELWAQQAVADADLYDDDVHEEDPGAGFEEHLTKLNLSGMWVAETKQYVIGLVGLLVDTDFALVRPLVVDREHRDSGVGAALLERASHEGQRRGLTHLRIDVSARNVGGVHAAHDAGFAALSSVTLTKDLRSRRHEWRDGIDLHDRRFEY